jgi:RNA polymerase sigma factor FliA
MQCSPHEPRANREAPPCPSHKFAPEPLSPAAFEELASTEARLQYPPEQKHILLEHLPMVRLVARKIHKRLPRCVDIEDLFSAGMLGLMEAASKFDPAKGIAFSSYAQFRVRGAILDCLRHSDWAPRSLRHKGRAVQEAIRELNARLGRAPAEEEIAAELRISLDAYQQLLGELKGLEIRSLHRERDEDSLEDDTVDVPSRPQDDPLFRCLQGEIEKRLTTAIEDFPERERLLISLCYYEELSRGEISRALGMSEGRIQQIRTSAVLHLRAALSDLSCKSSRALTLIASGRTKTPGSTLLSKAAA